MKTTATQPEQTVRDFLLDTITYNHLADYLCTEYGHDLAVWEDGAVAIVEHSTGFHQDEQPLARGPCPGIGNLDSTYFTMDFCDERDEDGNYIENNTGHVIGDLADVIRECCREGDVTAEYEELITALEASASE